MSTSRVEDLLTSLHQLTEVYREACHAAARAILSDTLERCEGPCSRVLYPRGQWMSLPKEYRSRLSAWVAAEFARSRCVQCYRSSVRSGEIEPLPRNTKKILSPEELTYLRRQVGLL